MNISSRDAWLNVNDDYNNGMGSVDIADQLRLFYRFHHWMRKSKWWHSIFWWGFGVQLVNAYKCYSVHHKLMRSKPLSHYDFQKSVGDSWVSNYASDEAVTAAATASTSSLTVSSLGTERTRRPRFCDASLDPMSGICRKRLDRTLGHWPYPGKRTDYCQLHRWATGSSCKNNRVYTNVVKCIDYNVALCAGDCFMIFHSEWDLQKEKHNIRNDVVRSP